MKKIFLGLLFVGALFGCEFSSKKPENAELLINETKKIFLQAKKFNFYKSGRILIGDDNGNTLAACRSEIFGFGKSMSIPIGA